MWREGEFQCHARSEYIYILTCLDEEGEDFRNGFSKAILCYQDKDMVARTQRGRVELKVCTTCDSVWVYGCGCECTPTYILEQCSALSIAP